MCLANRTLLLFSSTVGDLKNDFNVKHEFKPLKFELKLGKIKLKAYTIQHSWVLPDPHYKFHTISTL